MNVAFVWNLLGKTHIYAYSVIRYTADIALCLTVVQYVDLAEINGLVK
jgi:hypothetical protein